MQLLCRAMMAQSGYHPPKGREAQKPDPYMEEPRRKIIEEIVVEAPLLLGGIISCWVQMKIQCGTTSFIDGLTVHGARWATKIYE